MKNIKDFQIARSFDYDGYRALMADLVAEGKTSGPHQSEALSNFTKLNHSRMRRLDKTTRLSDSWQDVKLRDGLELLTITEAWCGDAAQINPVIESIAKFHKIPSKYVLRDENEDLINAFLTDGGKSIPIILLIDQNDGDILGHWGPRLQQIQEKVIERKNSANPEPYETFNVKIQKVYNQDKTTSIQSEFHAKIVELLNQ